MITYKNTKEFHACDLESLFLSVNWSSGKYPENLKIAMKNSDTVISAWDGENLVGIVNALSDKIMTAYFHYLLVHPKYQSQGIGKELMNRMLNEYESFARKILIAYESEMEFYRKLGFSYHDDKKAMFITFLST